jgi:hypothetical protein
MLDNSPTTVYFFLEHAGELRVIVLIVRKRSEYMPAPRPGLVFVTYAPEKNKTYYCVFVLHCHEIETYHSQLLAANSCISN